MRALQTEAAVSPSYGYLGQTLNVYLYFTTLEYSEAPTIDYLRFVPHGATGWAELVVNSSQVIGLSPLIALASVTIPTTALAGSYDVLVGLNGEDYVISNGFSVYTSPYQPTTITETVTSLIPWIYIVMMVGFFGALLIKK